MTDDFAINILEQYREKPTLINEIETVEEAVWLDEALDMAIKALEQEPCDDAISRQVALEIQAKYAEYMGATKFWQMRDDIRALPPVKPQESKTGHWIIIDDCEKFIAKCSECGQIEDSRIIGKYAYCHCGARMSEIPTGSESDG